MREFTVTLKAWRFVRTYKVMALDEQEARCIAEALFNAELGID